MNATISICGFTMVSTGAMLLVYVQHICGMLKITSYRIQHAIKLNVPRSAQKQWNENLAYKRIIYAVDIHREILQFADIFMSTFNLWFSLLIFTVVISTSLNFMRIYMTLTSGCNIEELTISVILLIVQYLYQFIGNYSGQQVIDHYNQVFTMVYNIQWYMTSLQMQKMILFLLQRGTKVYSINIRGLFVGSLEGFTTLLSASISYFTVIYSTR
ncbi:uncharacterized protein LOC109503863 isoform X2 [Harpegnathos saltator]|uniref:uncharacterized protein LOC109503863 isoform X2 n=1 Tax=Harpegnathos saltator TaxID=610380 RepID=UPI000DBEDE48|nr:uncharacterized protein LOC109503863 isoform X2 [Harpegnathos saltator]